MFLNISPVISKSVRELEGALNKVIIQAKILNKTVNIDDVKKALLPVISRRKKYQYKNKSYRLFLIFMT